MNYNRIFKFLTVCSLFLVYILIVRVFQNKMSKTVHGRTISKMLGSIVYTDKDDKMAGNPSAGAGMFNLRLQPHPNYDLLDLFDAQTLFFQHVQSFSAKCVNRKRFGKEKDGGYMMCTDPPYAPQKNNCLVYSFGINYEWSFDDHIHDELACEVHSFDPSMGKAGPKRKENLYFHRLGLWNETTTNHLSWKLAGLSDIIKMLGHEKRTIDYLKIDVEGSEWPAMEEMIATKSLANVKQMVFEIHTPKLKQNRMLVEDYARIAQGLLDIQVKLGFRLWTEFHINGCCGRFAVLTPAKVVSYSRRGNICCYELYYINSKFKSKFKSKS